ncbi:hypothetical protein NDA16_003201 [Ustilago loliicola]|nr:hypothetical protein NDA16_003201 [Ustilago loliicola]
MSFYSAFPSSPLSRSALASERAVSPQNESRPPAKPSKTYGNIGSATSSDLSYPGRYHSDPDLDADGHAKTGLSPFSSTPSVFPAAQSSRHVSGPARLMRSPFGPAWSPTASNTPFDDSYAVSPPMPSSSFTRSVNTRRRSSGYSISASSPTPNFGSLVGSFQESLLRGRMSMPASKPLLFDAEIGVLGMGRCKPSLRCPPHLHVKFPAHFYDFHAIDAPPSASSLGSTAALGSPYVGTIDLEAHYHNLLLTRRLSSLSTDSNASTGLSASGDLESVDTPSFPGYAVPPKGQVQLIVKYPDLNAVKLFLVPYDLTDMQPGTKTFVRQKTMVRPETTSNTGTASSEEGTSARLSPSNVRAPAKEALRFAIHLQFCCPPVKPQHDDRQAGFDGSDARRHRPRGEIESKKGSSKPAKSTKIYLHKTIRLVFGARALDSGEKLIDQVETPGQGAQRFSTYAGPEEDWLQLHHEVKSARNSVSGAQGASAFTDRSAHKGLGIDIQGVASHAGRSVAEDSADGSLVPLNSDPNGERWQGSSSFAQYSAGVRRTGPISSSNWSVSSQESGFESTADWSRTRKNEDDDLRSSIPIPPSSRLSQFVEPSVKWTASQAPKPSTHVAMSPPLSYAAPRSEPSSPTTPKDAPIETSTQPSPRSHSPLPPPARPSRIRSASTAGLSEARVQSVSALGRLEGSAAPSSVHFESVSADSPFTLRRARGNAATLKKAGSDRPSLLRKLSEQFARSHTPSPTSSPRLKPTWLQTDPEMEDNLAEMAIDDPNGDQSQPSPVGVVGSEHARSIR